uniref:alpha/beta hydrolase n=1 Tax=Actinomyces provencensis TaxID=1720198 RepID=UPI0011786CDA
PRRRRPRPASPASGWDTASLAGIAPGLVVTAQRDILRAEGTRYATRLEVAGALVAHVDVDGVGHGFNILGAPRSVVQPVCDRIVEETRRALS